MSSSQRMVAVLLCVILILAIIYFIILPCYLSCSDASSGKERRVTSRVGVKVKVPSRAGFYKEPL